MVKNGLFCIAFLLFTCCVFSQDLKLMLPTGHSESIKDASWSADGKYILSFGHDNIAIIWDVETGKIKYKIASPEFKVISAKFIAQGLTFMVACSDNKVRIYKTANAHLEQVVKDISTSNCIPVSNAAGTFIAGIGRNRILTTWDIKTGHKIKEFKGYNETKGRLMLSPQTTTDPNGGRFLLLYVYNAYSMWYDQKTDSLVKKAASKGNSSFFSPDGKILVIRENDSLFTIRDCEKGLVLFSSLQFGKDVVDPKFSNDGAYLFMHDNITGKSSVFLTANWQNVFETGMNYNNSAFSSNGNKIYFSIKGSSRIMVYTHVDGKCVQTIEKIPDYDDDLIPSPLNANDTPDDKYILYTVNINASDPHVYLLETGTGKILCDIPGEKGSHTTAKFGPDGKTFMVISKNRMWIYSLLTNKIQAVLDSRTLEVKSAVFSPNRYTKENPLYVLGAFKDTLSRLIDLSTLQVRKEFKGHNDVVNAAVFSPDGNNILTSGGLRNYDSKIIPEHVVKAWDVSSGKTTGTFSGFKYCVLHSCYSNDKKLVATVGREGTLKIWDNSSMNCIGNIRTGDWGETTYMSDFSADNSKIITADGQGYVKLFDVKSMKEIKRIYTGMNDCYSAVFSGDGKAVLAAGGDDKAVIWDVESGKRKIEFKSYTDTSTGKYNFVKGHSGSINSAYYSHDDERVVTAGNDATIRLWNAGTGHQQLILRGHTASALSAVFSADDKYLLSFSKDHTLKIWDALTGTEKVTLVFLEGGDMMAVTPGNYYIASKDAASQFNWLVNETIYPFDQFDLKYNRPDLVLQSLPGYDTLLAVSYEKAYLKRLKKMGFNEDMLKEDFHLPEIRIQNFEQMPAITDTSGLELNLDIKDTKYKLDRINIYINDVPVFGAGGIDLRKENVYESGKRISLPLAEGANKIQVSVLNQAGAESYKETVYVTYKPKETRKPDLYLITIGDSKYKDARFDLNYASKDAEDIASGFKDIALYQNIFTYTYTNEKVTRENILKLKDELKKARRDDVVIITVAGHGVLDKDLNYYLATYDMDFNNPSAKGLPYEELESLVDGIAPLKKVILLDACHSGEVDKEEVEQLAMANTNSGEVKFRAAGAGIQKKNLGLKTTSELMGELFTDLRRGTGATVISSAGGVEYAMESDEWKNGLFTYCLLHGLKDKAADANKDGQIMLSELQQYLRTQVTKLSNGAQQPTSRIENLTMDFRVW